MSSVPVWGWFAFQQGMYISYNWSCVGFLFLLLLYPSVASRLCAVVRRTGAGGGTRPRPPSPDAIESGEPAWRLLAQQLSSHSLGIRRTTRDAVLRLCAAPRPGATRIERLTAAAKNGFFTVVHLISPLGEPPVVVDCPSVVVCSELPGVKLAAGPFLPFCHSFLTTPTVSGVRLASVRPSVRPSRLVVPAGLPNL